MKASFTIALGYNNKKATDDTLPCNLKTEKVKLFNARNSLIVRNAKWTFKDYLCTTEEPEVVEIEAGCAPLDLLVVNVLTAKFSHIARYVSI